MLNTKLDFHSASNIHFFSSLKQYMQSMGGHVAPLGHLVLFSSQSVFALNHQCCMLNRISKYKIIVFGLTGLVTWCSNPQSRALEASMLNYYTSNVVKKTLVR